MLNLHVQEAMRCDRFLMEQLTLSRREALLLLEHQIVLLNGKSLTQKHKGLSLEAGSSLQIKSYDHVLSNKLTPNPSLKLSILQEGDGFVVVDKPAGMPVLPLRAKETNTVLNALVCDYPELQGVGEGGLRSGVVHRLDTDTSGVLLVATQESSWQRLRHAFKQHQVTKHYRTLVQGQLKGSAKESMYLYIAQHKPAKVRVSQTATKTSRLCQLSWQSLEVFNNASLLEIKLETGFLHQIRAMFAHKDYPVLGDKRYGEAASLAPRQLLHASHLKLEDIDVQSPDPADFYEKLEQLRN